MNLSNYIRILFSKTTNVHFAPVRDIHLFLIDFLGVLRYFPVDKNKRWLKVIQWLLFL